MSLLSIHVVSLNEDNNTSASSFPDTDDPPEEHISDDSNNTGKGPSSHLYKGKSALKTKVKGKNHVTFTPVTKKWTTAAAKLKTKVALKLKVKSKVKLVKQSLFSKKCRKRPQLSSIMVSLFSDPSGGSFSSLPSTPMLKTPKTDLKLNFKCSPIILSSDKTPSSGLTLSFSESSLSKVLSKLLNKCKHRPTSLSHYELKFVAKCFKCLNKVKACDGVKAHY